MSAQLWAFLGISVLVIVTPGPDTALTVRNTLVGGRRAGIWTALGVSVGQAIWALATSAGVVALIVASEPVFVTIKFLGAAYLIVLGAQTLWQAFRPGGLGVVSVSAIPASRLAPLAAFRQGVINDLGNPKMAAFFSSLLPQFAPGGEASFAGLLSLGLLFSAMTLAWLAAYAAAVTLAGDVLLRPRIRRIVESVTGAVLIALGLRLASEQR
jgi:threonine/homoserine/homoserine lactone efflux protein